MSRRVAQFGSTGARVMLALLLVFFVAMSAPALAVEETATAPAEEDHGSPSIDEIGTQNEVSQQYLPEDAAAPPFMRFLVVPLIAAGILMTVGLLAMYLVHQPRFAEERRSKRRR